jgi:hypothetical protein
MTDEKECCCAKHINMTLNSGLIYSEEHGFHESACLPQGHGIEFIDTPNRVKCQGCPKHGDTDNRLVAFLKAEMEAGRHLIEGDKRFREFLKRLAIAKEEDYLEKNPKILLEIIIDEYEHCTSKKVST